MTYPMWLLWKMKGLKSKSKKRKKKSVYIQIYFRILWDPQEQSKQIISIGSNKIYLSSLDDTSSAQV